MKNIISVKNKNMYAYIGITIKVIKNTSKNIQYYCVNNIHTRRVQCLQCFDYD